MPTNDFFEAVRHQSTIRASDGIGLMLLYRCPQCQRIWLQDGARQELDLSPARLQMLAKRLQADVTRLPASPCRPCLNEVGGCAVSIDEYGGGKGFGFSWEQRFPESQHALLSILENAWVRQGKTIPLPNLVTRPLVMQSVLRWFCELEPPRRVASLPASWLNTLTSEQRPGNALPGTHTWRWYGWRFSARCHPLAGSAEVLGCLAGPADPHVPFADAFATWQQLASLTLKNSRR